MIDIIHFVDVVDLRDMMEPWSSPIICKWLFLFIVIFAVDFSYKFKSG